MKRAREGVPVRYRARVEYDGTDFAGYQAQARARTVQGELEAALAASLRRTPGASGRRRADRRGGPRDRAGDRVHLRRAPLRDGAREGGRRPPPADVAIRDLRRVPEGFHPRHAARYREYRYTVWNGPRSPLRERTSSRVRVPLDDAAMARAATALEGRHDFGAFGVADRGSRSGPCIGSGSGGRGTS